MSKDWLEELSVGDPVVIVGRGEQLTTVERVTKTLIVTKHSHRRFRRSDGSTTGGGFVRIFLLEATPERMERARKRALARRAEKAFSSLALDKLPLKSINDLCDFLDSIKEVSSDED